MPYYALFYEVVDDFPARRAEFREDHLRLAKESHGRGELVYGGALADPPDAALLIFQAANLAVAEDFARNDPYVIHGLVKSWRARSWTVVVGNQPENL